MSATKRQTNRVVVPELLDSLPGDHPEAIGSRRDLRRLNWWMRNASHVLAAINALRQPPATIVETGSGDATFILSIARQLRWKHHVQLTLVDMQPVIAPATLESLRDLGWNVEVRAVKLQDWLGAPDPLRVDLLLANLFWHHFNDDELRECFAKISPISRAFIACEPRRWMPARVATRLLWALGCNRVTQHDAKVSVDAGFYGKELSALWPANSGMALKEYAGGYASHLFAAEKVSG